MECVYFYFKWAIFVDFLRQSVRTTGIHGMATSEWVFMWVSCVVCVYMRVCVCVCVCVCAFFVCFCVSRLAVVCVSQKESKRERRE